MVDEMDEIWALYADDGAQSLDAMEDALEQLRADATDGDAHIAALFRAVHTFKGNSRVLGLAQVEGMAHLAEDLIGLVRDEGVAFNEEIGDVLLQTSDVLRGMLDETIDTRNDVDPAPSAELKDVLRDLIGRLTGTTDPESAAAPAQPVPKAKPADPAAEASSPQADPAQKEPASTDTADAPDPAPSAPEAQAREEPTAPEEPEQTLEDEDAAEAETPPEAPAPKPAMPGLAASFVGLLDQLEGGDGADFDDFEDDDFDDTDLSVDGDDTVLAQEPPAEPEPAPAPAAPVLAEVTDGKLKTIDPAYRKIFADMVTEACEKLEAQISAWDQADSPPIAKRVVDGLHYAAGQMSLETWLPVMDRYLGLAMPGPEQSADLVADLRAFFDRDLVEPDSAEADGSEASGSQTDPADGNTGAGGQEFFVALAELYPAIADLGLRINDDEPPTAQERAKLAEQITALAQPFGYVRLEDAANHLARAEKGAPYHAAELALYEELVSIERTVPASVFDSEIVAPSKLLGTWCADHIFQTLTALRKGMEQKTTDQNGEWFPDFENLMRRVHFACMNFAFETASQLTMVLIDLFGRTRIDGKIPDIILTQIGRGFVQTMELVFDALDQGDTPDTSLIEKMFEDATNACFAANGLVTARTIENRLGLPPEFHRVLSPESVRAAHNGIEADLNFYVLRADLNEDDALAQAFLECITSGTVKMITNVTVFLDKRTLFDFLVASSLTQDGITEQLALLDPTADRLALTHVLTVESQPEGETEKGEKDSLEMISSSRGADNVAMLEAVGAISASHALLEHELSQLASVDLVQDITNALRDAGVPDLDQRVRAILRDRLETHSLRLMEISEQGTQLAAELSHLQQESVAQRSLPAEALLRPFKAHVAAQSVKLGKEATVTYVGGDVVLDQLLIEELRQLLKSLVALRLSATQPPTRFHLSVEAESDHIRVELTDNGAPLDSSAELKTILADVAQKKGTLRHVVLPAAAGVRFHLKLPQKMIVLDGMVVRYGEVRYVLPVEAIQRIVQTDRVVSVAAQGGALMLKADDGALVPIRSLVPANRPTISGTQLYVIVRSGGDLFAIPVDELLGQQLVLLRSLEGVLSSVRDMSGIAILSGGEIGMVVSVSSMAPGHQNVA